MRVLLLRLRWQWKWKWQQRPSRPVERASSQHQLPSSSSSSSLCGSSSWTLSFSGAGHLLPYHLGVAQTLLVRTALAPEEKHEKEGRSFPGLSSLFRLPITSVTGSSSGAIAATVATLLPHRVIEYTHRFLDDRGYAFRNLKTMLEEEQEEENMRQQQGQHNASSFSNNNTNTNKVLLTICTTRCSDFGIQNFSFPVDISGNNNNANGKANNTNTTTAIDIDRLLKVIQASCTIPQSFHPLDMIFPPIAAADSSKHNAIIERIGATMVRIGDIVMSSNNSQKNRRNDDDATINTTTTNTNTDDEGNWYCYPNEEGIEINGRYYVDGGIAAPFPSAPIYYNKNSCDTKNTDNDNDTNTNPITGRILVSPIAGNYYDKTTTRDDNNTAQHVVLSPSPSVLRIIQPKDTSWSLPPALFAVSLSSSSVAVRARPSVQNLRAMMTAMGVVPTPTRTIPSSGSSSAHNHVLRDWYERGKEDAHEFLLQHEEHK